MITEYTYRQYDGVLLDSFTPVQYAVYKDNPAVQPLLAVNSRKPQQADGGRL